MSSIKTPLIGIRKRTHSLRNEIENMRQQGAALDSQLNEMKDVVQGVVRAQESAGHRTRLIEDTQSQNMNTMMAMLSRIEAGMGGMSSNPASSRGASTEKGWTRPSQVHPLAPMADREWTGGAAAAGGSGPPSESDVTMIVAGGVFSLDDNG